MLLTNNSVLALDGDAAFYQVDNRRPPHQLEPGTAAAAVNQRFDEGKPRPRYGVGFEQWGIPGANLVSGTWGPPPSSGSYVRHVVTGFQVGYRYFYRAGNADLLTTGSDSSSGVAVVPAGDTISTTAFTATQTTYYLWSQSFNNEITTSIYKVGRSCAYGRFNDPNGVDNGVLLTDEIRSSDGGRGRAWRIYPGTTPQEIPLNGHDVWGTARLIQCDNQLVLLRHGRERHYFDADAVDGSTERITLNAVPAWENGDEVAVYADSDDASFPSGPNLGATYYARRVVGALEKMELYDTAANARNTAATTGRMDLPASGVTGRFYVERQALQPGFYGNFPPPLVLRASDTETAFEVGFDSVPTICAVTNTNATNNTVTAPAHGLQAGDAVTAVLSTDGSLSKYAAPQSDHVVRLYDSAINALADDGSTGLYDITADSQTGTIKRTSAAAAPMPGGTEGVWTKGRLLIINGKNLLISDPLDILHFTPFVGTLPTNQSESGSPSAILVGGNDQVLILNEQNVQEFLNLAAGSDEWAMRDVTREYGCLAPLTALRVGKDSWFLSRRGVVSVALTETGEQQGVAVPVSQAIARRFDSVDWRYARNSCAAAWNNRVFLATAFKGQSDTPVNNAVLVFNTLNQGWEDLWQGESLLPYAFSLLTIAGEERLTFATDDGVVCWFTDDFQDFDGAIATTLTTRGYFQGQRVLGLKCEVNWDSWNPSVTVSILTPGQGESVDLEPNPITYDRTQYVLDGATEYDPDTSTAAQFDAPHREDYSPAAGELLVARLDAHQNLTERFRFRLRDRALQVQIANTQGSLQINSIELAARPLGGVAAKET